MRLGCIGTGSKGNTIVLTANNGEQLLLDLGMSERDLKKFLGYNISNIVGACASHSHL